MKLIIQIPCYNEEKTLPETLADLPEEVEGVEEGQTLVINDGSTDRTDEVAWKHGVDYILNMPCNKGWPLPGAPASITHWVSGRIS